MPNGFKIRVSFQKQFEPDNKFLHCISGIFKNQNTVQTLKV
ncbi:hypothetical protein LEP1GSC062_3016 [Leptospira alexanderi serovar Manhao 3 str. L 60]|uniref:Uncharacterized protein n=1 Tax=Leptospira alexanderi serovar Manhao 3 str. L 60 TaxID=1049759 RepID=V6HZ35_9LEPT|nr:hypothetical protein LEP1GSC062_3016 [Leptospira alexanderi serovar Manhao 3 str. L 60]